MDSFKRIVRAASVGEIDLPVLEALPAELADPEALTLEAETRREVVVALDRLPERYRQVLVLKDGCGLQSGEVAGLLDTTLPSTKSVLFRARRMLREELASK